MGKIKATNVDVAVATRNKPWSPATYPFPDARLAVPDGTPMFRAEERLFWRSDGSLAYRAGVEYPVEDKAYLITQAELKELQKAGVL